MSTPLIVAVISAMAVIAFFFGIYAVVEPPNEVAERIKAFGAVAREIGVPDGRRRRGIGGLLAALDRLLSGQATSQRLSLHLAQGNVQLTVPEFMVITFSAAVVGGSFGFVLQAQFISALAGAIIFAVFPLLYIERKRQKRLKTFHYQLVPVLQLIVSSLRGGHALNNALSLAGKELEPPASEEFSRVLREMGFGLSQTEALNNLVKRMESDDLELIVTAINISHEVGGNLSLVLEKIADTIRERIRLVGEIRVLTTQQRLTTYLLVALPMVLGLVLALINPQWMLRLFAPGLIRAIPIGALVSEFIGFVIAQRLTKIEV